MTLSLIAFFSLTHFGIGIAWALLLVSRAAGVKFFRFNAGLAALLLVGALALRPRDLTLSADVQGLALGAAMAATLALAAYWATIGRVRTVLRPFLLPAAAAFGLVALIGQAAAATSNLPTVLTIASFLTSAALLGGTCTAMSLGHWFLVIPTMDVSHLRSIVKVHFWSTLLRVAVVAVVVCLAVARGVPEAGPSFERYLFSLDGMFFWQRVLFGLCGPAVLAYLAWETAKINSTQSATGILYIDLFTVIVGEVLAKYLLVATAVPV